MDSTQPRIALITLLCLFLVYNKDWNQTQFNAIRFEFEYGSRIGTTTVTQIQLNVYSIVKFKSSCCWTLFKPVSFTALSITRHGSRNYQMASIVLVPTADIPCAKAS